MLLGNGMANFHGGAVLLGNGMARCFWGMAWQVSMVALYY